jgi:hypothetical protein
MEKISNSSTQKRTWISTQKRTYWKQKKGFQVRKSVPVKVISTKIQVRKSVPYIEYAIGYVLLIHSFRSD